MNDELKMCPFCGRSVAHVGTIAEHEFLDRDDNCYKYCSTHYEVVCDFHRGGCGASTGGSLSTPKQAIEAWNKRTEIGQVKHGRWEFVNDYECRCTHCLENSVVDHADEPNYCPNCGAKMDEEQTIYGN